MAQVKEAAGDGMSAKVEGARRQFSLPAKGTDRSVAGSPCRFVHSDNICDGGTGK